MRKLFVPVLALAVAAGAACSSTTPAPAQAEAEFRPTGSIKEIMDSVIDPNADVLWESVSTTINKDGQTDKKPETPEDWQLVRRSAMTIIEGTNLLLITPRQMAPPGTKSEYPGIELEPSEMQKLVDADRTAWVANAHKLHDAAMVALKAIDAKNVQGLMDAGETLDEACENCHKQYLVSGAEEGVMMRRALAATVVCAVGVAGAVAAQERPVPSDSARVAIPGCSKGRAFIVATTPEHEPTQVEIAPGRRFRLSGPKDVLDDIKKREGRMIEVTGLVRKEALRGPGGIPIAGGRVRIGGGAPVSPSGDAAHNLSGYEQAVLDVEGWRVLPENCTGK